MKTLRYVAFVLAVAMGCSSSDDPTFGANATSSTASGGVCAPGQQIACACGGGVEGFQTCNADGSGYSMCSCGGSGGAGTGGSGGASTGAGGSGTGGATPCEPGTTIPCFDGPAGAAGVGACVEGSRTCLPDGSDYGPCTGQVLPTDETCSTPGDDDCDGQANEEGADCACVPGSTTACYTGPAGTDGVGICHGGMQLCNVDGLGYGACGGELLPQADDCNTPTDENCDGVNASCNLGVCLWSTRSNGYATGDVITEDANGNILSAGHYEGAADFGGGPLPSTNGGLYVVKVDLAGNHVWSKGYPTVKGAIAGGIATDAAGNLVVTGYYGTGFPDLGGGPLSNINTGGGFVAKYDASGNHLWSHAYLGKVFNYGVALDAAGNVFFTGGMVGTADFGGGPVVSSSVNTNSVFAVKLDANGQHVWSKMFSIAPSQTGYAVAVDGSGNLWLTGIANGTVDFGGGPITPGNSGVILAKLTTDGAHLFSKVLPAGAGTSIVVEPAGTVLVGGNFSGSIDFGGGPLTEAGMGDFFVTKLDGNGGYLWSKRYGGSGAEYQLAMRSNALGEIVLVGSLTSPADFGGGALTPAGAHDVFVAKLDSFGGHIYSKVFGDVGEQLGTAVAIDSAGNAVVSGYMFTPLDFGCGALTPQGQTPNAFLAKLSP